MHTTSRERHASAALSESGSLLRTDRIAGRGRVLLTTSDCRAGDVLLVEQPMAFVQLPECEEVARLCAGCSCQLGSPADGLRRLGVLQRMPTFARRTAVAALPCEHCNRLFYCSARCRAAHRRRAHAATCSADAAHRAAFDSFRSFALASCHTQLLAAELVAATLMLAPHTAAHGGGNGGGGGGSGGGGGGSGSGGGGSGSGGRGGGGGGGGSGGGGAAAAVNGSNPGFGNRGFGNLGFGNLGFGNPGFGILGFGNPGFGNPGFGNPDSLIQVR